MASLYSIKTGFLFSLFFFYINNIKKIVVVVVGNVNLWISPFSFEVSKKFFSDNFVDKKKSREKKRIYPQAKRSGQKFFRPLRKLNFSVHESAFRF